jgi:hypothetical protein
MALTVMTVAVVMLVTEASGGANIGQQPASFRTVSSMKTRPGHCETCIEWLHH